LQERNKFVLNKSFASLNAFVWAQEALF